MARPRVFISSTYFDLKTIREDLDRFIATYGYEPVRHERAQIPYGKDDPPEKYAYRELELCDILISIVGSRYGSSATEGNDSISQTELKRAHELGKQVYVFIEKGVQSEFRWFKANRDVAGIKYTQVDDVRIYTFVEELYAMPFGNPIFEFETGADIVGCLKEQWAGLFQRLLSQETQRVQANLLEELRRSLQTVDQMVKFLKEEKTKGSSAIEEILFANHPVFAALGKLLSNRYRLYFTNLAELDQWLNSARSYDKVDDEHADLGTHEWIREHSLKKGDKEFHILNVSKDLFDAEGKLKPMTQASWSDTLLSLRRIKPAPDAQEPADQTSSMRSAAGLVGTGLLRGAELASGGLLDGARLAASAGLTGGPGLASTGIRGVLDRK